MAEFDTRSIERIADTVRWVERFIAEQKNQFVSPPLFGYKLIEDVVNTQQHVKADIYMFGDTEPSITGADLYFRGCSLYGQKTGFIGDCHHHANVYWAIGAEIERHERFVMLSDWFGGIAIANFKLIESTTFDEVGVLEDPEGIFTDQLGIGGRGISVRTVNNRHFILQAKCRQSDVAPVDPMGACTITYTGPDNEDATTCVQSTSASCALMGGTWVSGGACP